MQGQKWKSIWRCIFQRCKISNPSHINKWGVMCVLMVTSHSSEDKPWNINASKSNLLGGIHSGFPLSLWSACVGNGNCAARGLQPFNFSLCSFEMYLNSFYPYPLPTTPPPKKMKGGRRGWNERTKRRRKKKEERKEGRRKERKREGREGGNTTFPHRISISKVLRLFVWIWKYFTLTWPPRL